MTYTITSEDIKEAKKKGACEPAIEWLSQEPRTLDDLARHKANWLWWGAVGFPEVLGKLAPETLEWCKNHT